MVYFDHSASTIPSKIVLDNFYNNNLLYPGNYNSPHYLGNKIKEEVKKNKNLILSALNFDNNYDILFTSGATESNNYAITSFVSKYNINLIISDSFEHSSIIAPLSFNQKQGINVKFVSFNEYGIINLEELEELIKDNKDGNTLVSIAPVNSEIGIKQDIEKIKKIINKYDNCYFHTDATQAIGKININYNDIDMISFSCHKIYGLKGIGGLIYKKDLSFLSIIKGGDSESKYRSGTPAHPLILSVFDALNYTLSNNNYDYVLELKKYLITKLKSIKCVKINSNRYSIPHIVNVSFIGYNSLDIVSMLSNKQIFISNHTACNSNSSFSQGVLSLTHDEDRSKSSVRISLSFCNNKDEIDYLIKSLKEIL